MPFRCMKTHQANRPLGILQRRGESFQSLARRNTILEQRRRHAIRVKPLANLRPFQIHRQNRITSAGTNHHRRAGVLAFGRPVKSDGWNTDIAQPDHRFSGHETFARLGHIPLLADVTLLTRRAVGPERHWFRCSDIQCHNQTNQQDSHISHSKQLPSTASNEKR